MREPGGKPNWFRQLTYRAGMGCREGAGDRVQKRNSVWDAAPTIGFALGRVCPAMYDMACVEEVEELVVEYGTHIPTLLKEGHFD